MATPADPPESKRTWCKPAVALLMGAATLGAAWCFYQSSRWSGQSGGRSDEMSRLERRAMELDLEGKEFESAYMTLVMQWLNAHRAGQESVAVLYIRRLAHHHPDLC